MQRIGDIPGTGADSNGDFSAGDPTLNVPATIIDVAWLNSVQREIANIIESKGLTLDPNDDTQLAQALSGGASTTWMVKTAAYTAVVGDGIDADTSGGAFTLTLPLAPSLDDEVPISDYGGVFDTFNLTVNGSGKNIQGSATDLTLDKTYVGTLVLKYNGTEWRIR